MTARSVMRIAAKPGANLFTAIEKSPSYASLIQHPSPCIYESKYAVDSNWGIFWFVAGPAINGLPNSLRG